jgi:hypothetical protein
MPRKKPIEPAAVLPGQLPLPGMGHNSEITDDALIAENFKLEDEIKAAEAKLAEWAKPRKERVKEIESEIHARLIARGADNTKTPSGTAYFSHLMNTKIEDGGAVFDWAADHWAEVGDDVKINVKIDTVRTFMENNGGHPPPGIIVSYFTRLNIKRS